MMPQLSHRTAGPSHGRDQVFIGNQREQLQEEPAQVPSCHINPVLLGGDAMRWALREYGTGVEMSSAIN